MVKTAVLKELKNIQISEVRFAVSHFGKTLLWGSADIYGLYVITQFAQQDAVTAGYLFFLLLACHALLIKQKESRLGSVLLPTLFPQNLVSIIKMPAQSPQGSLRLRPLTRLN